MSGKRALILAGMVGGLLWGLALLTLVAPLLPIPRFALIQALGLAFFFPALVMIAMVGRLAQRRFFDETLIDGQPFAPASPAAIDQRVLTNTVEQFVLALAVWPMLAFSLGTAGGGIAVALGIGFSLARILFWVGYHRAPPLRAFGFAATFTPTMLAALWALWRVSSLF